MKQSNNRAIWLQRSEASMIPRSPPTGFEHPFFSHTFVKQQVDEMEDGLRAIDSLDQQQIDLLINNFRASLTYNFGEDGNSFQWDNE